MNGKLKEVLLTVICCSLLFTQATSSHELSASSSELPITLATEPYNDGGPYNTTPKIVYAGTLLAVPGKAPVRNRSIIIKEGSITEIREGYVAPADVGLDEAEIVDLREKFVLPGLIDTHVHITSTAGNGNVMRWVTLSDPDRAIWAAYNAAKTLEHGFTTIRDLAANRMGTFQAIYAIRDGIRMGKVPGPRIVSAGQAIGATGTLADFNGFRHEILELFKNRAMCSGVGGCREAVRYQIKRGADLIKIGSTGGVSRGSKGGDGLLMFDDEIEAIVETAHKMGRKVAAHATSAQGVNAVLRAGVDTVEHGAGLDNTSIKLFKKTGAYLVPTLLVIDSYNLGIEQDPLRPPETEQRWVAKGEAYRAAARKAHAAGVKIAFGSDVASIIPHGNNALEFAKLIDIGMTPMEAITSATVNAADALGLADEIGTLEEGKAADIVALDLDPLADVTRLESIQFVMRNGIVYKGD